MKKILATTMALGMLAWAGSALATTISFDPTATGSSVIATDTAGGFLSGNGGDITATLASNLESQIFNIQDGETAVVDFFTLTASGFSWDEDYTIEATLAFDAPIADSSSGSGSGNFSTIHGILSGGTLSWDTSTLPDVYTDTSGNIFSVNFESGSTIGLGSTTMVHAYVTNEGGGQAPAPVPEPATMLLFGTGLLGLVGYSRKRAQKS